MLRTRPATAGCADCTSALRPTSSSRSAVTSVRDGHPLSTLISPLFPPMQSVLPVPCPPPSSVSHFGPALSIGLSSLSFALIARLPGEQARARPGLRSRSRLPRRPSQLGPTMAASRSQVIPPARHVLEHLYAMLIAHLHARACSSPRGCITPLRACPCMISIAATAGPLTRPCSQPSAWTRLRRAWRWRWSDTAKALAKACTSWPTRSPTRVRHPCVHTVQDHQAMGHQL